MRLFRSPVFCPQAPVTEYIIKLKDTITAKQLETTAAAMISWKQFP